MIGYLKGKVLDLTLESALIAVNGVGYEVFCSGAAFSKLAAHCVGERKFAVRERARTRKSGGDVAVGLAIAARSAVCLGALALFDGLTLFDDDYLFVAALPQKLDGGEDARGTRAHNANVVFFHFALRKPRFPHSLVHYKAKPPFCQR